VVVIVIVPLAFAVPTPFSLKIRAAGEGVEAGVVTAGVGNGASGEIVGELVPVLPQATADITSAANATHLLITEVPLQLCTRALPVKVT